MLAKAESAEYYYLIISFRNFCYILFFLILFKIFKDNILRI